MNSQSTWLDDEALLIGELRRSQRAFQPPQISGCEDLRELRRGGQGVVFLGKQTSTRRLVAIKLLLDGALASAEARRRFEREIGLVATLRHPNVVRVYDSGETSDGRLYYIMEYIEGVGLDEVIGNAHAAPGPLSPAGRASGSTGTGPIDFNSLLHSLNDILALFAKVCDGVQHAHQQGVIHRDLKPSNVRIDSSGEPHVLDFGLAKWMATSPEATLMSHSGGFLGSLPWASPEQAEGLPGLIDIRSDVYSLGVMLYQLVTREFPYSISGTLRQTLERIRSAVPRPPRELRPELSDDVARIILKCLSKAPERRYQSAGDLARDIRRYLAGEPIEAKRDSAWYTVRKALHRYKTAVRVIGASLLVSVVCSVAMTLLWMRAVKAERLAENRLGAAQSAHAAEVQARKATETQVEKTRKVAAFLDSTMRAVDPWKHPGRDLGPLREMLDAAVERLHGSFPDQPDVEAALAATLGWDYWMLEYYDAAEVLLRRSYELYVATLGEEQGESLSALSNLATLLTDQGKYAESTRLFERLLALQRRRLGPEDWSTLRTMNNLAHNFDWQGRSEEAETLYRAALTAQTRVLGRNDPDRLNTLNNLAACLPEVGKSAEAERLYHELIEGRIASQGPNHPETLQARMNFAQFLSQNGRAAEAEPVFRELLKVMEGSLGPSHPLTLATLNNLASAVSSQGRLDEGLSLSRKALEAQVALAGPDHPSTLVKKTEYVTTLIELRQWDEAVPLARELKEQDTRAFGRDDWRTLNIAGNLAFALNQSGQAEAAEAMWKEIVSADVAAAGPAMDPVIAARANLGALYTDQNRWADAEPLFRSAITSQLTLGRADHWRTGYMRYGLGRVLLETDRLAEAKVELEAAYPLLNDALGEVHEKTQRVIGCLVRLYQRSGDAAAARTFSAKVKRE